MHPRLLEPSGHHDQHGNAENKSEDKSRPSNDIPQPLGHQLQLIHQSLTLDLRLLRSFRLINKQAGHVEKTCEPGHHKNEV